MISVSCKIPLRQNLRERHLKMPEFRLNGRAIGIVTAIVTLVVASVMIAYGVYMTAYTYNVMPEVNDTQAQNAISQTKQTTYTVFNFYNLALIALGFGTVIAVILGITHFGAG